MSNYINISKISSFCLIFMLSIVNGWSQCAPPSAINVTSITQIGVTIQWTSSVDNPVNGYDVEIRTSGAAGSGGVGFNQGVSTTDNSITINGLDPENTYFVYVRSLCPTAGAWSTQIVSFTTSVLAPPVAVAATNETASSFVARWDSSIGATAYELLYSASNNFANAISLNVGVALNKLISTGLTSMTTYYYKVRARNESGPWTDYGNVIEATTTNAESTIATWTSIGWLQQPTELKDLFIEADFNTLSSDFGDGLPGKSMTIAAGVNFTIGAGSFIRIEENVTNNSTAAQFIIESNGNFNQQSGLANSGGATVKRNSFPIFKLDYTMWSSPVAGQNLLAFSPQTLPNRFYSYNSSSDNFDVISTPGSVTMQRATGYLVRAPNNWVEFPAVSEGQRYPGKFVGVLNAGPTNLPLNTGYNMVGNPYPCDIFADALFEGNTANEESIWFWRRRNNSAGTGETTSFYATYNSFGATGVYLSGEEPEDAPEDTRPDGIIKIGQGFIVQTKALTGGNLLITKEMKIATEFNSDIFLKKNDLKDATIVPVEKHKFYLGLTGAVGINSEILMGYASTATDGADSMDSGYIGDSPIALTSLINSDAYVIQAKALPFQNTSEFALRFQTSVAASYTISLGDVTGMFTENVDPILVDMLTNTETNLRNASYTFASEIGIFDTRFKVVFVESALGTVDVVADANAIVVMSKDNVLSINAGTYTINNIQIYDMLGRNIYSKQGVDANTTSISDLRAQNQIILVQVATDHGVVTKKVQF